MTTSELMAPPETVVRRRSSRRRRRTNAVERLDLIGVIACAAGAVVFVNPASATTHRAVDLLFSAAIAGVVALAGARARRWSVIWLAGVAAVGAVGSI
jgi:hypothetical protein